MMVNLWVHWYSSFRTDKKEDLRNVVIVVTRYFGGIKLGGGD